ncbi:hypothetical protein [Streptomyces sp. NRRL S-646]|uniref:hypothetical protein n=1 Tax=Streptomyces sp. NRRL S-646 TaxID=1463917 RepID=UPI0013311985|nr:hypothetical protein [Streptomyces sp. NRRL S-646]
MDAAPIVAKIEEMQREMEGHFDQMDERLSGLKDKLGALEGSFSGLAGTTAGIVECLTDLTEGRATKAEILAKLRALSDRPSD